MIGFPLALLFAIVGLGVWITTLYAAMVAENARVSYASRWPNKIVLTY